jgi:hypothetical protein
MHLRGPNRMNLKHGQRALPTTDSTIDALCVEDRALLSRRWLGRAQNELGTSTTFAELYRGLVALEASSELLVVAAAAVGDELRHAEICHAVAERYAGQVLRKAPALVTAAPRFNGCSDRDARVLHVVLHACLNEGVAAAYLGACLEGAESDLARIAVKSLLKDEIHHARLGWAFLASANVNDRALVAAALPELMHEIARLWLSTVDCPEHLPQGHGCLGFVALRRVFMDAVADLILPGFDHAGIPTGQARAALAKQPWMRA